MTVVGVARVVTGFARDDARSCQLLSLRNNPLGPWKHFLLI